MISRSFFLPLSIVALTILLAACDDPADASGTGDLTGCTAPPECTYYVDAVATSPEDGTSWTTPFDDVQEAIDAAASTATKDRPCHVWVTEGTYEIFAGDRADTLQLHPFVDLYGGFSGENDCLEDRDPVANETILDGLNQCYHVVTGSDDAVLDGFVVTGGNAEVDQAHEGRGGGMYNREVSPIVRNCIFRDNSAIVGGGMANDMASETLVVNCSFEHNVASWGGGVINWASGPRFEGCSFETNQGLETGGGMYNLEADDVEVVRSFFEWNYAFNGAGVQNENSSPGFSSSVFSDNYAGNFGGGICNNGSSGSITNVTFCNNLAVCGGSAVADLEGSSSMIVNSILWDIGGQIPLVEIYNDGTGVSTTASNSIVRNGAAETSVTDEDPGFVDPTGEDLRLTTGSPAIDAADDSLAPTLDIDENERVDVDGVGSDSIADIGAYEYLP